MYKQILVPIDLSDPELAKPAIANAVMMARQTDGTIRLVNVLPLTPVMLAEYVPPDFEVQQRKAAEDAHRHHRQGERARAGARVERRFARAASIRRSSRRRTTSMPISSS